LSSFFSRENGQNSILPLTYVKRETREQEAVFWLIPSKIDCLDTSLSRILPVGKDNKTPKSTLSSETERTNHQRKIK
jgi:hypothetical protein